MKIVATIILDFWPKHTFGEKELRERIAFAAHSAVMEVTGSRSVDGICRLSNAAPESASVLTESDEEECR